MQNSTSIFFHNKSAEEEKRRSFLEYNLLLYHKTIQIDTPNNNVVRYYDCDCYHSRFWE